MMEFNQMYNFVENNYEWYIHARQHAAYQKERHYHRCERKRFNGKTFRHKTKYLYQIPYYIKMDDRQQKKQLQRGAYK